MQSPLQPQLAAAAVRDLLALGLRCGAAALGAEETGQVEVAHSRQPLSAAAQCTVTGCVPRRVKRQCG
jgi:hypothetical protein